MSLANETIIAAYERFYLRELILDRVRFPNKPGRLYGCHATLDDVRRIYTLRRCH